MAVQQGYGKMAGTDALVFAYDTGDAVNSYKGEPTENLAGPMDKRFSNWSGLTGSTEYYTTSKGDQGIKLITTSSGGVQWYACSTIENIQASTEYTISATIRYEDGGTPHPNLFYVRQYDANGQTSERGHFSTGLMEDLGNGWKRVWRTFTTDATTTHINLQGYEYTTGRIIYMQDLQFELKSHKTSFAGISGTRSATEGLKDLTGNQVIELSDMSFDSNGKITFDGITNYIDCGDIVSGRQTFSAESWVKTEDVRVGANGSYKNPSIFGTQHGSGTSGDFALCVKSGNLGYYAELGVTAYKDSGVFIADNIWHHLAVTKNLEGVIKLYVDGVEIYATAGNTATLRTTDLQQYHWEVGRAYWRGEDSTMLRFNGDIATHRFYDRALSASEILANYNNQKTKYNLN